MSCTYSLSKSPRNGAPEGVRAPCAGATDCGTRGLFGESSCLGLQPKVGGKLHLRLDCSQCSAVLLCWWPETAGLA